MKANENDKKVDFWLYYQSIKLYQAHPLHNHELLHVKEINKQKPNSKLILHPKQQLNNKRLQYTNVNEWLRQGCECMYVQELWCEMKDNESSFEVAWGYFYELKFTYILIIMETSIYRPLSRQYKYNVIAARGIKIIWYKVIFLILFIFTDRLAVILTLYHTLTIGCDLVMLS